MVKIRYFISAILSPHGFRAFLFSLPRRAKILDVGCGNDSPYRVKSQRPDVHYTGIDVGDYNQTKFGFADQYIVVAPEDFTGEIGKFAGSLDAIISSHNIEHCDDPATVVLAMAGALKPGGCLYMSFPSEQSTTFPSRGGCLNFFDDPTHRKVPIFEDIKDALRVVGVDVLFARQRFRPPVFWLLGALIEPISRMRGRILPGTWAFYGFESVIWAKRKSVPNSNI